MREFKLAGGERTITQLSYELSESINTLADRVSIVLDESVGIIVDDPQLCDVLLSYCPAILVQKYRDRIVNDIPRMHQLALIAAFVSAKMLYQEGIGWADKLVSVRTIRDVIFGYLEEEKVVASLIAEVKACGLEHAEKVAEILESSGRNYLTLNKLGLG